MLVNCVVENFLPIPRLSSKFENISNSQKHISRISTCGIFSRIYCIYLYKTFLNFASIVTRCDYRDYISIVFETDLKIYGQIHEI